MAKHLNFPATCLFWFLLLSSSAYAAGESRPLVVCSQEPKCLRAVANAFQEAKTDRKQALIQMLAVASQFPDPRLDYSIGRLYQQTGIPSGAVTHFQHFLESGVEQDPERISKARAFLDQAERDSTPQRLVEPPPVALALPPAPPQPVIVEPPRQETSATRRPAWRIALGVGLSVGGSTMLGVGASPLPLDRQCLNSIHSICATPLYQTGVGSGLVVGGYITLVGGLLIALIPNKKAIPQHATSLAAISTYKKSE